MKSSRSSSRTPKKRVTVSPSRAAVDSPPKKEKDLPNQERDVSKVKRQLDFDNTETEESDKENEKEIFTGFTDETDAVRLDALDHYFFQGKLAALNKKRTKRGKKNRRGEKSEKGETEKCVEVDDDDDDQKNLEAVYAKYEAFDLSSLKLYLEADPETILPKSVQKATARIVEEDFPKWKAYLALGFNIMVQGVGSKRNIIHKFVRERLKDYTTFEIEGFRSEVNVRAVLGAIDEKLKLKRPIKRRALTDWASAICKGIVSKDTDVFIIIHNVDAPNMRDAEMVSVLCVLAGCPRVKLILSVDHINASFIFNTRNLSALNLIYARVSTMEAPAVELLASESNLLGLNTKGSTITHTLASLDAIWTAFHANSQKIFRLFFAIAFASNTSVNFWDLLNEARDKFLVSTDVALRQQLVEFDDHKLLRIRRSEDGTEKLSPCVEKELIEKFLAEKGLSLDLEDDE